MQVSRQAQYFALLGGLWRAPACPDSEAGAALCEPRRAEYLAVAAVCKPQSADAVAHARLCERQSAKKIKEKRTHIYIIY